MKKYIAINLFLILYLNCFSQKTGIDSIDVKIDAIKSDTQKVNYLNQLFEQYEFINNELSTTFAKSALDISISSKFNKGKAASLINLGFANDDIGNYDKALTYYTLALNVFRSINDETGVAKCYNYIGIIHKSTAEYDLAIEYLNKALDIFLRKNDEKYIATVNNNLGITYYAKGDKRKSLEYYINANVFFEKQDNKYGLAATYCNIANVYKEIGQINEAIDFHEKAIILTKELGHKNFEAVNYNGLGIIYSDQNDFIKAKEYHHKALEIRKEIGDKYGAATSARNLAGLLMQEDSVKLSIEYYEYSVDLYSKSGAMKEYAGTAARLGSILVDLGDFDKALEYTSRAVNIAENINSLELLNDVYKQHCFVLDKCKKIDKAYYYQKLLNQVKDSLYNENKQKALSELGVRYDTERKENEIKLLNKDKELKQVEIQKQRVFRNFLIGVVFLVILVIIIVVIMLQNKRKANIILKKLNADIGQQKEEIEAQRDEIESQRDLVTLQKNHIEEIHKEVTDSINYAKRIQEAVLPISKASRSVLGEHFILFRPKDIVSGDFYWTAKIENTLIVSVADCTGHGVPGAFMSMLGISFLNEIIRKKEILKASEVLNELRIEIINALQQTGTSGEQKDGMDISLIAIDTISNKAQWAGANNPLWVVKSSKPKDTNFKTQENSSLNLEFETCFLEFKADKMPIAIYEKMGSFTNHELQLYEGDILYLLSDGYEDQFGGPKQKKFLSKNFKKLIVNNCQLPMVEQKSILENTLVEWIGEGEQIDDITVLGIKI